MNELVQTDRPAFRQIYIVVSQTGTLLSRILKAVTGAKYNHVSLSLSPDLMRMYSFGRLHPYNPFWGGFVMESPCTGTFKRFTATRVIVFSLSVSGEVYDKIACTVERMLSERDAYHYNYLGLFLAAVHIRYRRDKRYYCSEFVRELLFRYRVNGAELLPPIVQPIHFLMMPNLRMIYCGYLRNYPTKQRQGRCVPQR